MSLRSFLAGQTRPVVFPLPDKWPCSDYTIEQWGDILPDLFEFRHESKALSHHFENQQKQRFRATIKDFGEAIHKGKFVKEDINLEERWVYSAYNWMSSNNVTKKDCLNWTFFDPNDKDCSQATIWFGSRGAFTPCHRDTYGINLSVQLIGSKEWLLFPPSDSKYLYETRLPYEETTIFSSIDFNKTPVDTNKWPMLKNVTPYRVVLKPGQVLFVPKHWWHFVRCVDIASVNVNRWFEVESDAEDKIDEALAAFLASRIQDLVTGSVPPINSEPPVGNIEVILEAIRRSIESMNSASAKNTEHPREQLQGEATSAAAVTSAEKNVFFNKKSEEDIAVGEKYSARPVQRCPLEHIATFTIHPKASSGRESAFPLANDIFKSILDPEVVTLIRHKLMQTHCCAHLKP